MLSEREATHATDAGPTCDLGELSSLDLEMISAGLWKGGSGSTSSEEASGSGSGSGSSGTGGSGGSSGGGSSSSSSSSGGSGRRGRSSDPRRQFLTPEANRALDGGS